MPDTPALPPVAESLRIGAPLPRLTDTDAWKVPANSDDVRAGLGHVRTLLGPATTEAAAAQFAAQVGALAHRGYSRAEWHLIALEGPFRTHYGQTLNLATLSDLVAEHRTLRSRLQQHVTTGTRDELCAAHPQLDLRLFRCVGADERGRDLWKYAPHLPPVDGPQGSAVMLLESPKQRLLPEANVRGKGESISEMMTRLREEALAHSKVRPDG